MHEILEKLNAPQREAVMTTEGPVLIIAGAGSGKTRALTHRVAYLICEKKINPRRILAVTFTNKAAGEMKERIRELLSDSKNLTPNPSPYKGEGGRYDMPTVGTFHSICVRILRHEIEKMGYKSSFNIFDDQDQLALMKKVMKEMEINTDQFKPKAILGAISNAKNELKSADEFLASAGGYFEEMVAKIYLNYQKKLKDQGALDFDDILMIMVKLFQKSPEVLEKYQNFFEYIMVDEYQDTNRAQYLLVKLLSQKYNNLCVVGDDWQGIYSWRGANIQNILDFEKDYPQARVIKLEQNYRSTQNILDAAYGVISKNINRKDKKIWTDNQSGHLLSSFEAEDEKEEAQFIVNEIKKLCGNRRGSFASLPHRQASAQDGKLKFSDFVVLYRTNAQSRMIEEAMLRNSIPYRIIGGVKFYQRKEIKDMIAYLRVINNFNDETSLERIINEPRRGIGEVTLNKWIKTAKENEIDLINIGLKISDLDNKKILNSKIDAIIKFSEFIQRMSELKEKLSLTDFIQKIYSESGYEKFLMDGTEEGEMRNENVRELLTVAKKYEEYEPAEGLKLFLEEVALVSDTDNIDQAIDAVHLMTLHSAKGLEFKIVFIAGLEEGILPHSRSMLSDNEMEEERRLMYVGITRAMEKVYLLFTRMRNIFGSTQINASSRFLEDVPTHLLEDANSKSQETNIKQISNFNPPAGEQKQEIKNIAKFKDGDRVRHEVFGDGLIVASAGDIITVAFSKTGLKKLSISIAQLEKIK
ncbi:MAG: ATP-dependent DNA helicase pcrA [Candidatus Moranbacteria bacterium GW2011_GWF2_36_839]|nr:MAG: ATP-dependent DNA helicase pcrA [Candidatus Moranbacteria bacterium GW2011_GWF1_36_78]KKQ17197.1 MAG: ATP-dependent DNA helicase pcrA [Candidatus Moranbacteria bacterium GW2011_GWF2_36_839]HAT73716.1 ATP-dependent DNA helicase PcrA [Candidatus Moranbacteria bacterium]HBY11295.1 ATP-dependent DNA helicase PcrA [Candidatus Moranbacteria bacterium]